MFKKSIILIIGLIVSVSVYSQLRNDSIQRYKSGGSYRYEQSGRVLTLNDMTLLMNQNTVASAYLAKAKSSYLVSNILGGVGGFCIGYPLGVAIAGGRPNWTVFALGCGFVVVAIPISISSTKNVKMAVDTFNRDKTVSGTIKNGYDLKLGVTQNGLGLTLRF